MRARAATLADRREASNSHRTIDSDVSPRRGGGMRESTRQRAISMLAALLERGRTYREVGQEFGVGHSTVERQVKAVLWQVARERPIPGVPDIGIAFLHHLRTNADTVMQAVRSAKMAQHRAPKTQFDEHDLMNGLRRIRRLSENANRDAALLLTLVCTGAKPSEIARLRVRDYLADDGTIRCDSWLPRTDGASGNEQSTLFDANRMCDAINVYLDERLKQCMGVLRVGAFRDLDPNSALFLTENGQPFRIRCRSARDARPTCPSLLATYACIFRRADWQGANTQHVRRAFAQRVADQGADTAQLKDRLGVRDDRSVKRLLECPTRRVAKLVEGLV